MTQTTPQRQRRSKLYVDRRLQGGMVRRILCHWLIFLVVGTNLALLINVLTHITEPWGMVATRTFASLGPFLFAMLALIPVFAVDTIKLTNRFAGPFVRFRSFVNAVARGQQPARLKFRDGDFWCDAEADLNALFEEITELRQATGRSQLPDDANVAERAVAESASAPSAAAADEAPSR